jgi:hypothetical protein
MVYLLEVSEFDLDDIERGGFDSGLPEAKDTPVVEVAPETEEIEGLQLDLANDPIITGHEKEAIYHYTGRKGENGELTQGKVIAYNRIEAQMKVAQKNIRPIQIQYRGSKNKHRFFSRFR